MPENCNINCALTLITHRWAMSFVVLILVFASEVGFNPKAVSFKSASQNMPSASLHPSVIDHYLHAELEKGRVAGSFSVSPTPNHHLSRFGIIVEKNQGKGQHILGLASPLGHSKNLSQCSA